MRLRVVLLLLALALLELGTAGPASAAEWHSEQPVTSALGVPTPLGPIGDIEFEAPNRGALITQGNEANPPGVYAYDGVSWHLYSTVCGGHDGRIAWEGPDSFWTISDQRMGQEVAKVAGVSFEHRSLCHFVNGEVVASYAEPLGTPTSYLSLNAAACAGPNDCWFAGERLPGTTNVGAFHLHWDGSSLTTAPSLTVFQPGFNDAGRTVTSLASQQGRFYEGVEAQEDDTPAPGESPTQPYLLHRIVSGSTSPFSPITTPISFGPGVLPWELEGFRLSTDGSQLWAVAGGRSGTNASPIALRLTSSTFAQLTLQGVFKPGDSIGGVAAEPGSDHAWVSYSEGGTDPPARLAEIHADGTVDSPTELPSAADGIGHKGSAGPVACPAQGQCWMATETGWLFHLGGLLPQDTDPAMHVLITTRPEDNGLPFQAPDELPPDDSGAEREEKPAEPELLPQKPSPAKPRKPIVYDVHQHLDGSVLELSFKLRARAHVQLLGKRKRHVVAKTKRYTMGRGPHSVRLRLDPDQWPTAFAFEVHAIRGPRFAVSLHKAVAGIKRPKAAGSEAGEAAPSSPSAASAEKVTAAIAAEGAGGSPIAETVLGSPSVTFLGASPLEAQGEVWATGNVLYQYTEAGGWVPFQPLDAAGQPYEGLVNYGNGVTPTPGLGRTTPVGGVAALATDEEGQVLVVRDPGGPARIAPDPGPALHGEETLSGGTGALDPVAAFEAAGGHTGAFVVPVRKFAGDAPPDGILRFDGSTWSREPICVNESGPCQAPTNVVFQVLAIDATSESNALMLARGENSTEGVVLFKREEGEWRRQPLGGSLGSLFEKGNLELPQAEGPPLVATIAPRIHGQPLTVTSAGAWVDVEITVGSQEYDGTIYYGSEKKEVESSWCDIPTGAGTPCAHPLGSELPAGEGRSFAWPPDASDPYGRRVITGIGEGAILSLAGVGFVRQPLLGGDIGASGGAALSSPTEGWLGGGARPVRLTPSPQHSNLVSWAVPFRRPLTAVAAAPDEPVAGLESEAIAVGVGGEVAHYRPGVGWQGETLVTASGAAATPRLRAAAWPTPGFAYAVGDGGEMWMWRAATGLWESDPGKPPNLIRGNFTSVAFDPNEPERGYAVGQQGLLLAYGKQWSQEALPLGISPEADFTSLSFASSEALLAYRFPREEAGGIGTLAGGVLVNSGAGWQVEEAATAALEGDIPSKVAGLPDGGAVIVGVKGTVIEREAPGAPWSRLAQTVPSAGVGQVTGVAAVAAFREGGEIRAVVAGERSGTATPTGTFLLPCSTAGLSPECEQLHAQPPAGQAPLLTRPYLLPPGGFLLRQTTTGWHDEQHGVDPLPPIRPSGAYDLPREPDPLASMLVSPDGSQAWAVGGQTGVGAGPTPELEEAVQTAAVYRYPADAVSANASQVAIAPPGPGEAALAIGGEAECMAACADYADAGIGPDVWLPHAISEAAGVAGMRAFLYTGPGAAPGLGSTIGATAFGREEEAFASRLGSSAGLPVYAAAGESDLDATGTLSTFSSKLSGLAAPQGGATGTGISTVSPPSPEHAYFSFASTGASGTVRVVVLDYSHPSLGVEQRCWLATQLSEAGAAGIPAVVVGNRDVGGVAEDSAEDAAQVVPILVGGAAPAECPSIGGPHTGASAYFFDFPGQNRTYQLSSGGRSIPAFGSGTLGYAGSVQQKNETDFVGASGFMLASINLAGREPATNVAPVTVRLVPNIAELAVDATNGTLLRRSSTALFEALARRPKAGGFCKSPLGGPTSCDSSGPDPYIPIPSRCFGARCGSGLFPEYKFVSSDPEVADFVEVDPASNEPRAVLLGSDEKPIPDSSSGLLCAYNAGTTTVTLETGGLAYSTQVTVQAGSVQRPCGTVPLQGLTGAVQAPKIPVEPFEAAEPGSSPPPHVEIKVPPVPVHLPSVIPVSPQPMPPVVHQPPAPVPHQPLSFFPLPGGSISPIVPIVPPPPPPAAQPTPPSGTSPVTQPAFSPEPEQEEEAAFDLVHHMAAHLHRRAATVRALEVASSSNRMPGLRYGLPALVALLALAGAGAARPRRRVQELAYESRPTPRSPTR